MSAACAGGGGAAPEDPDAAANVDAAPGPDAPVPINAVIRVRNAGTPLPWADVVISHADGTFHAHLIGDAEGVVHAAVHPGDMATAVLDHAAPALTALTVTGLQPGDDITIDPGDLPPARPPTLGSLGATVAGSWPAATEYRRLTDCDRRDDDGPVASCRGDGRTDVVGLAVQQTWPPTGAPVVVGLAYALQRDVPFGAAVTLDQWRELAHLQLALSDPWVRESTCFAALTQLPPGGRGGYVMPPSSVVTLDPGGAATVDQPFVPELADGYQLLVGAGGGAGSAGGHLRTWRVERHAGPVPTAHAIVLSDVLLQPPGGLTIAAAIAARPVATWIDMPATGTAIVLDLDLGTWATGVRWRAFLPPGAGSFQLPELPDALAVARPDVNDVPADGKLMVIDASWQSWEQFRAAPDGVHDRPPPLGGVTRIATFEQFN